MCLVHVRARASIYVPYLIFLFRDHFQKYSALRISLIQMKIGLNKSENLAHAINSIRKTVEKDRPKLVALPECFNAPYGTKYFSEYAESIPNGQTCVSLSDIAKELKIYLIGGTIPERDSNDNKLYNTCTVWSPTGDLIAKYRKVSTFACSAANYFESLNYISIFPS